jgi:hypothetical protein
MGDLKAALVESEELENTDLPDGVQGERRNREAAKVYSVRLQPSLVDELERVATELDIPTGALIRSFIADGLHARSEETPTVIAERMEGDLQKMVAFVMESRAVVSRRARGTSGAAKKTATKNATPGPVRGVTTKR